MVSSPIDIAAISGICGSISIACWVVVFSPQIIENFRRSSAEGLSVEFVIIWLAGDVFNILGSVLQGVLPTMIILAIYYTFADVVLLAQCFYYRGFHFRDPRPDLVVSSEEESSAAGPTETSPLLHGGDQHIPSAADVEYNTQNRSRRSSFRERLTSLDATHLSPAAPMHPQPISSADPSELRTTIKPSTRPRTWAQAILFNSTVILLVVAAGILGWYLSPSSSTDYSSEPSDHPSKHDPATHPTFNLWGQIFGYICALLYLASRVPQLLLNYRRKSTEGLNALFFIFACIGNLTYVFSILAFETRCSTYISGAGFEDASRHHHGRWQERSCSPDEARAIYGRYLLVNLSWLIGSFGALMLDFAVFGQFWVYRTRSVKKDVEGNARE
jgi:uncharacterized protein with PQ loop repeat